MISAKFKIGGGPVILAENPFHSVLTAARMAEPYPELLAASLQLMAGGHRPE
jgi:hypothetical protein